MQKTLFGGRSGFLVVIDIISGDLDDPDPQIISNISNPKFELEQIIEKIPLNNDYFRKLFQKQVGKTPLQFLTHKRISYAKQLLHTKKISKLSIKEIAWRSGFSDYYYFSRVFKLQTGVAPSDWSE